MKDYLADEKARNIAGKHVLTDYVRRALREPACDVLCLHHVTVTRSCDENGNEIPSADTVLFDHDFARAVFGETGMQDALCELALTPADKREAKLAELLCDLEGHIEWKRSPHVTEVA